MQEYRGYELSAAALGRELVAGQVCVLTVGKSKVGRLFVLPLATWEQAFVMEFGADVLGDLARVSTRTATNDGLEEAVLLRVLVEQVDVGGNMVATSCLVVRLGGEDAAILVPANAFWRERTGYKEEVVDA